MLALRVFCFSPIIAVLTGLALGQQPAQNPSNSAIRQAVQLAREHRYAEAEATVEGVNAPADPDQKIAFFRLKAAIASGLGHFAAAAENMDNAARLAPGNQDLRIAAGIARLQDQVENHSNPAQTLKWLRAETLPPQQAVDIRLHLAEILSRANLFSEAVIDFAAQLRSGGLDNALASAERAKSVADSGSIESLMGDIQEKRGDPLAAVHSYQAAVTLEPSEERYHLALGLELLRHQTFDAALVVFKQASALFPQSVRVKILLGLTYFFVDRSAEASQALQDAAKIDPRNETVARYLGEITLQDTSTPDPAAIAQVCTFADEHPQSKTADAFCGGILLKVARDGGDISRRPEILRRLRHAAHIAPREPIARCQLGKAFEWSGMWSQARPETEACVRLDPGSPDGHYQLSRIYRRMGLTALAHQQIALQQRAALRQSEASIRRTETVTKFLVLLEH